VEDGSRSIPAELRPSPYNRPAILILLAEHDGHGYELVERLAEIGFEARDARDSASLYRLLRAMEREGLTTSSWDISNAGPPRRVYCITSAGQLYLRSCEEPLTRQRDALDALLDRYRAVMSPPTSPVVRTLARG
jgi:poly-beta-hydroxybutyrate-responsive repressor